MWGDVTETNNYLYSGRDDWLWLSEEGEVTTWINQRGVSKTMRPYWLEAEWNPTHAGVDEDIGEDRWQVQFGRFFGSGKSDVSHPLVVLRSLTTPSSVVILARPLRSLFLTIGVDTF